MSRYPTLRNLLGKPEAKSKRGVTWSSKEKTRGDLLGEQHFTQRSKYNVSYTHRLVFRERIDNREGKIKSPLERPGGFTTRNSRFSWGIIC